MRRRVIHLFCLTVVFTFVALGVCAQDGPDVVVFYREGCHDCERMDRVLEEMHALDPSLSVRHIEEGDPDGELLWALATEYGIFPTNYPVIFVGDEAIVGVGLDKELRLRTAVEDCLRRGCDSPLLRVTGPKIPWRAYIVAGLIAVVLLMVVIDYAI